MATLSSRLIVSLVDRVSGPARAMQASLGSMMGLIGTGRRSGIGGAMAAQMSRMQHSAGMASATLAAPLALIGRSGFEAAYGLEKMMNKIQAVGMLTDEQRAGLSEYIQLLNKDFPFTNQEIGGAALELFRAGLSFDQARGALRDTLSLALAGDISRQEASDIATNIMTAMRLPMETSEQAAASVKRVADVLAYAANKSNTDVRKLGETFKYVAPMASAAGLTIDQVAASAMTMANNGIKGSEAGIAMRAALVRMAKPTKDTLATLARLNIKLSDFITGGKPIQADDIVTSMMASGIDVSDSKARIEALLKDKVLALKPAQLIATMTDEIATAMGDSSAVGKDKIAEVLSDTITAAGNNYDLLGFARAMREKGVGVAEIARIMDVRQGARVLTLLLDDLEKKAVDVGNNSAGAAQKMADTMQKGIVGAVARLQAAWENMFVTIGKAGVLDAMSNAFDRIANGINRIGASSPEMLRFGTYSLMALGVLGPLGLLLQGAAATMTMVGAAARIAGLGMLFLGRSMLITAPVAAFRGIAAAVAGIGVAAAAARAGIARLALASVLAPALTAKLAAGGLFGALVGGLGAITGAAIGAAAALAPILAGAAAVAAAGVFIYNNWQGIKTMFAGIGEGFMAGLGPARGAVEGLGSAFSTVIDWLGRLLGPLDESGAKWRSWGETIGNALAWPIRKIGELFQALQRMGRAFSGTWIGRRLGLDGTSVEDPQETRTLAERAIVPTVPPKGSVPSTRAPTDSAVAEPDGGRVVRQADQDAPPPAPEPAPPAPAPQMTPPLPQRRPERETSPRDAADRRSLAERTLVPVMPRTAEASPPATPPPAATDAAKSDIAGLESTAQQVPVVVQAAMGQVRSIVGAVDLRSEGQRIIESLATGMRAGVPSVARAAQAATAAAVGSAMRGSFGDGAQ